MTDVTSFDGTRLGLDVRGPTDGPVVVLVHGLGLSSESWGDVPEHLADAHRVVAYDLRGHAQSGDARSGDYSMSAHVKDLDAVLRAVLADGERAVVAGSSLGGGIIVAHADDCGTERVAGAVFAGSGGSGVTFPGLPARDLPDRLQAAVRTGYVKVLRGTALVGRRVRAVQPVSDRLIRSFAFTSHADHDAVAMVRDSFLSSRPEALAGTTLASVSHDGTRLAPALDVPTLVLHGTADPEVPDDEVSALMDQLPDGELVQLEAEGHMLPLTEGELVAEQIARWVRRVTTDGPA